MRTRRRHLADPVAATSLAALVLAGALVAGCASYKAGRLYQSGTAALDRRDPVTAIVDLERAAQLAPHASEVHNHLGLAYAAAGRDQEALAAFEQALAADCDNRAAQHNLARARERAAALELAGDAP